MAARIFVVENKLDNTRTMYKAETKGQVNAFLRANTVISAASSTDVFDLMSQNVKVFDATAVVVPVGDSDVHDAADESGDSIPGEAIPAASSSTPEAETTA